MPCICNRWDRIPCARAELHRVRETKARTGVHRGKDVVLFFDRTSRQTDGKAGVNCVVCVFAVWCFIYPVNAAYMRVSPSA